jgi:hypothetical protein
MLAIKVKFDEKTVQEAAQILRGIPKALPAVMSRTLNRTASATRTLVSRNISSRFKTKVGVIRKGISITNATYKNWLATMEVADTKGLVPVIEASPVQTAAGVTYIPPTESKKGGGGSRQLLPHAFIATGPVRGRQVWLRSRYRPGGGAPKFIDWQGRRMEAIFIAKVHTLGGLIDIVSEELMNTARDSGDLLEKNLNEQIALTLKKWAKR